MHKKFYILMYMVLICLPQFLYCQVKSITLDFSNDFSVHSVKHQDGNLYTKIKMPGYSYIEEVGMPAIPTSLDYEKPKFI